MQQVVRHRLAHIGGQRQGVCPPALAMDGQLTRAPADVGQVQPGDLPRRAAPAASSPARWHSHDGHRRCHGRSWPGPRADDLLRRRAAGPAASAGPPGPPRPAAAEYARRRAGNAARIAAQAASPCPVPGPAAPGLLQDIAGDLPGRQPRQGIGERSGEPGQERPRIPQVVRDRTSRQARARPQGIAGMRPAALPAAWPEPARPAAGRPARCADTPVPGQAPGH